MEMKLTIRDPRPATRDLCKNPANLGQATSAANVAVAVAVAVAVCCAAAARVSFVSCELRRRLLIISRSKC